MQGSFNLKVAACSSSFLSLNFATSARALRLRIALESSCWDGGGDGGADSDADGDGGADSDTDSDGDSGADVIHIDSDERSNVGDWGDIILQRGYNATTNQRP